MRILATAACLGLLCALGCAGVGRPPGPAPLRMSDVAAEGDARRRASLRLVQEGLAAEEQGDPDRGEGRYERAIQVDPTNPYAYLALARYTIESGDPARGLRYLDRAERLMEAEGALTPGVDAHRDGLRGSALIALGRTGEGEALLARAQQSAPDVWSDGWLTADELR